MMLEWKDIVGNSNKVAAKQVPVTVYEFKELSPEAKKKALDNWYENEDYPFLSEDLTEYTKTLLSDNGITNNNGDLKVYASLSHSQGDGACFVGNFEYKDITVSIKHSGNYYHSNSVSFYFQDENGDMDDNETTQEFKSLYKNICHEIETDGYGIVDYRMTDDEMQENCEANDYNFYENGKMANL